MGGEHVHGNPGKGAVRRDVSFVRDQARQSFARIKGVLLMSYP